MSIFDCWQAQREPLRAELKKQTDLSGTAYALRHALLQTEQNALAEMSDDVLRQQAGVLFSGVKSSLDLLETPVVSRTWAPQVVTKTDQGRARVPALWAAAAVIQAVMGICSYLAGQTLGWILSLAAMIAASGAYLTAKRKAKPARAEDSLDTVRVTLHPDAEKLLSTLDAQMRALDRYLNDFSFLNDQLRGGAGCTDGVALSCVGDLLESLYDCEGESAESAQSAARHMLESMGLLALDYDEKRRGYFTTLPSKSETRTLSPALVAADDHKLLKRGTAAVKMDVA